MKFSNESVHGWPGRLSMGMVKRLVRPFWAPAVFLLLAFYSTWPLAAHLSDRLPMGTEPVATVPMFNLWTVWWNADRVASGYAGYWDAPIFHPHKRVFSFSEPMPLSLVAAPAIWIAGNRISAYNLLLILSLWLNGLAAYGLLRRLGYHPFIPWFGGTMVVLLPLVHCWLGVLQLVPLFGIIWTLTALHRLSHNPTLASGTLLGTAFSATFLMCAYYGLFLVLPLALSSAWLLGSRLGKWRTWASLFTALVVAIMICLPFLPHQGLDRNGDLPVHTEQYLAEFSAMAGEYLVAPWPHGSALSGFTKSAQSLYNEAFQGFRLCPGFMKLALAALGLGFGMAALKQRRWTLFCLTLMVSAFLLSLGPWLNVFGWKPYMILVNHVPGFGQARNVLRFALFVHLMVVFLAMTGLDGMLATAKKHMQKQGTRRLTMTLCVFAGLLAVVEILPPAQPLYTMPDVSENRLWINWLKQNTPKHSVVACLPFPFRPDVAGYEQETRWMYWQTFHHRAMVNGYSGYFPQSFLELKMAMASFPSAESLDRIRDLEVDYCIVKRNCIFAEPAWRLAAQGRDLEPVFHDDLAGMDIYRLLPDPKRP